MKDAALKLGLPLALLLLALSAGAEGADPYAVGDEMEPFTLEDQHGEPHTVAANVALILFGRDMDGGDILKQALADAPEGLLAERKAAYVADISRMPKLVARMFALPAMRRRPYAVLLDRDGATTARLPSEEGKATLIFRDAAKITRLLHLDDPAAVRSAVEGGAD